MPQRPRVLLLIPHLGGGGAERVTELLARHLSSTKYDIHLGLVTSSITPALSLSITVHSLCATRVRNSLISLLRLVRRLRPQLILSTMAHLNFAVLVLRPFYPHGTRVLVRQNGTVSRKDTVPSLRLQLLWAGDPDAFGDALRGTTGASAKIQALASGSTSASCNTGENPAW